MPFRLGSCGKLPAMTRTSRFGRYLIENRMIDWDVLRLAPNRARLAICLIAAAAVLISVHSISANGIAADGISPDGADDQYAVAASFYDQKQWDLAAEEFKLFIDRYPNHAKAAEAVYYLGEIFLHSGQFAEARKRFDQYLHGYPDGKFQRAAAFRAAETAYLAGDEKLAKRLLENFTKQYPGDKLNAFVLPYLGELALSESRASTAANLFQEALDRFPNGRMREECRLGLARALNAQGKHIEAQQLFRSIATEPASGLALEAEFRLGVLLYDIGEYDESLRTLKRVAENHSPRNRWRAHAQLCHALALRKLGKTDAAHSILKAICNDPKVGLDARYWLAIEQKESGDYTQSAAALVEVARKCLPDHGLFAAVHYHAGDALLHCGHNDEALKCFETVLSIPRAKNGWVGDALCAKAAALIAQNRYSAAISTLETYLDEYPIVENRNPVEAEKAVENEIRALGRLSICYLHKGDFEKAKAFHARLMADHAEHKLIAATIEKMAQDALEIGETVWSARLFEWLAEDCGQAEYEPSALAGLAWSRLENNQKGLAAATFERLLNRKIDPQLAAEAAFARGRLLEGMQRFDGALAMYDLVVERYTSSPQHPKALLAAARLRARLSLAEEAAELYRRLLDEYPSATNLDVVLYELSWPLRELGQTEESNGLLRRIHREHTHSQFWPDATYRLAAVSFDAGDYQQAGELIERIIAALANNSGGANPTRQESLVLAYAFRLKWQIAALDGRWDEVGRTAARLLEDCPQSELCPAAEYWVAESMYRCGDYLAAAKRLDKLMERADDLDRSWAAMAILRRAQVYVHQKQWSRALSLAAKITKRFPDFQQQHEADYLIGRCRASRAEFEEARQAYLRVVRSPRGAKTETAAMAQWMIGETYFHQKDYISALKAYQRVETLYDFPKWQAAALLQAAKCRKQMGNQEEAAQLCRRLVKKFPDSPFAEEAARRLRTAR